MVLKISLCFALVFNLASSSEYSGLLSRLYQKAADENRPLILVLDNSLKDHEEPRLAQLSQPKSISQDLNVDRNEFSLHDFLTQKHKLSKVDNKQSLFDRPTIDHKHSDLQRLKIRLEKEKRNRKERRERKNRAQDRDDDKDLDRNVDSNQDRKRDRHQDRINERDQKNREGKRDKNRNEKRALRSSVIENLLRTFNDLNCDAKDECQDECNDMYNGKKKHTCENTCEVEYECEQSEKEDACGGKNECASSEEFTSTKGEVLQVYTEKCKRC